MNAAFEDCLEMDVCLEEMRGDWAEAFQRFFERRKPNAEAIADMAIENYTEMRASVIDPKFLLKKKLAFELERRQPTRFVPRYAMVMFRDDIGYAEARSRGRIQLRIMESAIEGKERLDEIDLDSVEREVLETLPAMRTRTES
jgi:kynurenine 3-monooxygenase